MDLRELILRDRLACISEVLGMRVRALALIFFIVIALLGGGGYVEVITIGAAGPLQGWRALAWAFVGIIGLIGPS